MYGEKIEKQYMKSYNLLLNGLNELGKLSCMVSKATGHNMVAMLTGGLHIEFRYQDDSDGLKNTDCLDINDVLKLIENKQNQNKIMK